MVLLSLLCSVRTKLISVSLPCTYFMSYFLRTNSDKGYIGPADFLNVGSPDPDQKDSPHPKDISRRISTASAGSDTSLNRPSSPIPTKKRQNAWGAPNRYSNSDDTASISSRSLPGSPSGSPNLGRKETSQRLSLSNTDMDVREEFKSECSHFFCRADCVSRCV